MPDRSAERKNLLNEERRRAILELLQREGRVLVADLAREFHTSEVTVRKDLEALHRRGVIQRTHGGALPTHDGALEDPSLREKERLHKKEKLRIAAAAAELVSEGQVVILGFRHDDNRNRPRFAQPAEPDCYHEWRKYRGGTLEFFHRGHTYWRRSPQKLLLSSWPDRRRHIAAAQR